MAEFYDMSNMSSMVMRYAEALHATAKEYFESIGCGISIYKDFPPLEPYVSPQYSFQDDDTGLTSADSTILMDLEHELGRYEIMDPLWMGVDDLDLSDSMTAEANEIYRRTADPASRGLEGAEGKAEGYCYMELTEEGRLRWRLHVHAQATVREDIQ